MPYLLRLYCCKKSPNIAGKLLLGSTLQLFGIEIAFSVYNSISAEFLFLGWAFHGQEDPDSFSASPAVIVQSSEHEEAAAISGKRENPMQTR